MTASKDLEKKDYNGNLIILVTLNFYRNFKVSCQDQINIIPRKLGRKPQCRMTLLSRISDNIADNESRRSETLKFKEPRRHCDA